MAVFTYKCPNCDGGLVFDPATQDFACDYCASHFSQQTLEAQAKAKEEPANQAEEPREEPKQKVEDGQQQQQEDLHAVLYSCPSCGAEVVTDETTAATYCFYCHNPVVLTGRLSGDFRPDSVIPFAIQKQQATEQFLKWAHKKKFVPKSYFSEDQIEKLSGIYFPHWFIDCDVSGVLNASATRVRVWRTGDREYTETKFYNISRAGDIAFRDIAKNALQKADAKLLLGVQPYDMSAVKAYDGAFLSGFQAEKRDIEANALAAEVEKEVQEQAQSMMKASVSGYSTVRTTSFHYKKKWDKWKYTLLPVWVLTYIGKKKGKDEIFYYAMNGQNGKVNGVLPVDKKKLALVSAAISAVVFGLSVLGVYLF